MKFLLPLPLVLLLLAGCVTKSTELKDEDLLPQELDEEMGEIHIEDPWEEFNLWMLRMYQYPHTMHHYHMLSEEGEVIHYIDVRLCLTRDDKYFSSDMTVRKNTIQYQVRKKNKQLTFYVEECRSA